MRLYWINHSQMPREAEVRLVGVTRLATLFTLTGCRQVLGLRDAHRNVSGSYEATLTLGGGGCNHRSVWAGEDRSHDGHRLVRRMT